MVASSLAEVSSGRPSAIDVDGVVGPITWRQCVSEPVV
jgi:hypothetical protein